MTLLPTDCGGTGRYPGWSDDSYAYYPPEDCTGCKHPNCPAKKEAAPVSIPSSAGVAVEIKVPVSMAWIGQHDQIEREIGVPFKVSTSGSTLRLERAPQTLNGGINVVELDKNGLEAALAMLRKLEGVI
jgi:hypothetical protein